MRAVFVLPERCIGCRQCMYACAVEHSQSRNPALAPFESPRPHSRIHVEAGPALSSSFPNRCRHCSPAPCRQVCPTGAITRDDALDVVLVDTRKCIACAMCAMVCPFDAVTFHEQRNGTRPHVAASKCDGCVDRIRRAEVPACVEACKVGALVFGDVNDAVRARRAGRAPLTQLTELQVQEPSAPAPEGVKEWRHWGEEIAAVTQEVAS